MDLKKILKKAFDAGYNTSLMYNNLGNEAHRDFQEFYKKQVTEQLTLTDVVVAESALNCNHEWINNTHRKTKYCKKGCAGFYEIVI